MASAVSVMGSAPFFLAGGEEQPEGCAPQDMAHDRLRGEVEANGEPLGRSSAGSARGRDQIRSVTAGDGSCLVSRRGLARNARCRRGGFFGGGGPVSSGARGLAGSASSLTARSRSTGEVPGGRVKRAPWSLGGAIRAACSVTLSTRASDSDPRVLCPATMLAPVAQSFRMSRTNRARPSGVKHLSYVAAGPSDLPDPRRARQPMRGERGIHWRVESSQRPSPLDGLTGI